MHQCPKCSSNEIGGPAWQTYLGREHLKYWCIRCRYSEEWPTHDSDAHRKMMEQQLPKEKTKGPLS